MKDLPGKTVRIHLLGYIACLKRLQDQLIHELACVCVDIEALQSIVNRATQSTDQTKEN